MVVVVDRRISVGICLCLDSMQRIVRHGRDYAVRMSPHYEVPAVVVVIAYGSAFRIGRILQPVQGTVIEGQY